MFEIQEWEATQIIDEQMSNQGCVGHDLESIESMQPHLYQWICFFKLQHHYEYEAKRYAEERNGVTEK